MDCVYLLVESCLQVLHENLASFCHITIYQLLPAAQGLLRPQSALLHLVSLPVQTMHRSVANGHSPAHT